MEYNLTAWKLACDVWATGESCTPAHGLHSVGGRGRGMGGKGQQTAQLTRGREACTPFLCTNP